MKSYNSAIRWSSDFQYINSAKEGNFFWIQEQNAWGNLAFSFDSYLNLKDDFYQINYLNSIK